MTVPVTAFAHQHDFYQSLACRSCSSDIRSRDESRCVRRGPRRRPTAARRALAGQPRRRIEIPRAGAAGCARALARRATAVAGRLRRGRCASERLIARALNVRRVENVTIARGVAAALADADAAFVASGTAVLEAVLAGVPSVALYIVTPIVVGYGRRMQRRSLKPASSRCPTSCSNANWSPSCCKTMRRREALADALEAALLDPAQQYEQFAAVRARARTARCARALRALRRGAGQGGSALIRLYHTSDLHDHRGFASRLRALRAERPGLLFDCGDSLRGSQTVYHRREPIVDEIDAGRLRRASDRQPRVPLSLPLLRARARKMMHPLVCSNLLDTKGRALPFLQSMTMRVRRGHASTSWAC